ncbi:MAG: sulfatase-like hydrolase/transferase [Dokdonella sp.]
MSKWPLLQRLLAVLMLPVAVGIFVFSANHSAGQQVLPVEQFYLLSMMLAAAGLIAFATGRSAFALILVGGLFYTLHHIAETKFTYLHDSLLVTDLYYFTGVSVLDTLQRYPELRRPLWQLTGAAVVLFGLAWVGHFPAVLRSHNAVRVLLRGVGVAACAMALMWVNSTQGPFAAVWQKSLWNALKDDSHLTNFFVSAHKSGVELPVFERGDAQHVAWPDAPQSTKTPARRPDIFSVLQESTFDPRILPACNIAQCESSLFEADARTRAHGVLRVHTFGGGTFASEFAAITGIPHTAFGPAGMYAPYQLAPRIGHSLPRWLSQLGYRNVAIYPMYGNFLGAREAYAHYGFDSFHDADSLGIGWDSTDADVYAAMNRVLDAERAHGQPLFVMVLTLYQHGPHSQPLDKLPAPWNAPLFGNESDALNTNLGNYLWRMHSSAEAMTALERQLLDRAEPTVLMQFGDHQPAFDGLMMELPQTPPAGFTGFNQELTYFTLKSNLDTPPLPDYPVLDIGFLPSLVLQAAGLPLGAWFGATAYLRDACDGRYLDCPDTTLTRSFYDRVFNELQLLP